MPLNDEESDSNQIMTNNILKLILKIFKFIVCWVGLCILGTLLLLLVWVGFGNEGTELGFTAYPAGVALLAFYITYKYLIK